MIERSKSAASVRAGKEHGSRHAHATQSSQESQCESTSNADQHLQQTPKSDQSQSVQSMRPNLILEFHEGIGRDRRNPLALHTDRSWRANETCVAQATENNIRLAVRSAGLVADRRRLHWRR